MKLSDHGDDGIKREDTKDQTPEIPQRVFHIEFPTTDVEVYRGKQKIGYVRRVQLSADCNCFEGKGAIEFIGNDIPDWNPTTLGKLTVVLKNVKFLKPLQPEKK